MKVMFSAGEASGDTHAASVANALREIDPSVDMFGMGGTLMERAGVRIVYDIKNLGVIGIVEIVKSLPKFFKLRTYLKRVMMKEKPDILVCVDYPGFKHMNWVFPFFIILLLRFGLGTAVVVIQFASM